LTRAVRALIQGDLKAEVAARAEVMAAAAEVKAAAALVTG
jgi:hypothetical protein